MKELFDTYVGKQALYNVAGMSFDVRVTDVKMAYGNIRFNIVPVSGLGGKWVQEDSITFPAPTTKP